MTQSSYPGVDSIRRHVLPNGITVLAYENFSSATVVMQGLVRAGALLDPPGQAGLADFTSDLLMRGTEARTFDEIYEALESVGAGLGFGSGRHTTQFNAHGLVEDVDLLFDLMTESLCRPTFPAGQVEQLRGQIMTGLQMRANDTGRMARLRFNELLYAGHPYAPSISGYEQTITAITRDDLARFHHTAYGPEGMIVTVVGAIPTDEAIARVAAALGDWNTGNGRMSDEVPDQPRPAELRRHWHAMPEKVQADIVMGLPGPRRSAEDYLEASLMNTILGVFGMMGRIGQSVREEQGLAYYAYSRLGGGLGPGAWSAAAGVAPDKVEQAVESIRTEIRRIQDEPVEAEELADSKAYRIGSLPVSLETNGALADIISDMEFYGLGLDYLQTYSERIRRITVEDVQAAARKYLSADEMVVAVAGPNGAT
jgi:zinc protease